MGRNRFTPGLLSALAAAGACALLEDGHGKPRGPSGRETTRERWARLGLDRSVEADGLQIHYVEAGTGEPVFLLHGMGDCAIGWRGQVEPLAQGGYRAIAWDMPGAGLSDKPLDRDVSIPSMRALFDAFRERLGVGRAVLVGSSYGGAIALLQARLRPGTVRALLLIDPACYADPEVTDHARLFQERWFTGLVWPLLPAGFLARYGLRQCVGSIDPALLEEYAAEAQRPGAKDFFVRLEQQVVPPDPLAFEEGHRQIRAPTRILWGRNDRLLPVRLGERLAREIPGAELVLLDAGHIAHLERPAETNRIVLEFLRSLGR
ncbi:MAG TPA: alpha/beta hydrolase [Planctomycetota bacterium]|jgi:pimeloyl-ACP methyl ester carboxylesterase|nr:alpha/beta hydrolase [Planctomycetota bacterium]